MPRILGVDVPNDKQVWVALTYIYGVGQTSSKKALDELGIDPATKARDLPEQDLARIASYLETTFTVEGQLRRQRMQDIGRLNDIGCYRGLRHRRGLPVRGQRTRCNARSRKGPKKTIANKKIQRK